MTPTQDELSGRLIDDRWQVGTCLRKSELHRLYKATDVASGSSVHLKVLYTSTTVDETFRKGFAQQFARISAISHPNVLIPTDYGFVDDLPYLISPSFAGVSLKEAVQMEGRFTPSRVCELAEQISDALGAGHATGVVHGSLSSNSIVLVGGFSESEQAYVLDFGLSHFFTADDSGSSMTESGLLIGNPEYMAPEQVRGFPIDAATDIYSFATIIYELLSGNLPFPQTLPGAEGIMDVLMRQANDLPPPLPADIELVEELQPALRLALQKEPSERPQTVAAFIRRFAEATSKVSGSFSLPATDDSYLIEEASDYLPPEENFSPEVEQTTPIPESQSSFEPDSTPNAAQPLAPNITVNPPQTASQEDEQSYDAPPVIKTPEPEAPAESLSRNEKPTALLAEFRPFETLDEPIEEYIASTSGEHSVPDFTDYQEQDQDQESSSHSSSFDELQNEQPPTLAPDSRFQEFIGEPQDISTKPTAPIDDQAAHNWLDAASFDDSQPSVARQARDTAVEEIDQLSDIGANFDDEFSDFNDDSSATEANDPLSSWNSDRSANADSRFQSNAGSANNLQALIRRLTIPLIAITVVALVVVVAGFVLKGSSSNTDVAQTVTQTPDDDNNSNSMIDEVPAPQGDESFIDEDEDDQSLTLGDRPPDELIDSAQVDSANDPQPGNMALKFGQVKISEIIIASKSGKVLAQEYAKAYRAVASREDKKLLLEELHKRMTEAVTDIRSDLEIVIMQYARANGYGLIVGDDGSLKSTLFVAENIDPKAFSSEMGKPENISDVILSTYNSKLTE